MAGAISFLWKVEKNPCIPSLYMYNIANIKKKKVNKIKIKNNTKMKTVTHIPEHIEEPITNGKGVWS